MTYRRLAPVALIAFAAVVATIDSPAQAAPAAHDIARLHARHRATPGLHQHAQSRVIFDYGKDYVLSPACTDTSGFRHIADPSFKLKVYLNFDGEKLTQGGNDSRTNKTNLILLPTLDYPAFSWSRVGGRATGEKAILDELKILFGPYAIEFVTSRPADGDYTMIMVGGVGTNVKKGSPGTVGIAPLDCKNDRKNDLAVVFADRLSSAKKVAYVIAHELGHTLGLVHINDPKAIMNPGLTSETCCFRDGTTTETGQCGRSTQDAPKVLTENVGKGEGDKIPPVIWFARPGADALLPPSFSIEVGANDDLRVARVDISVDGKVVAELDRPPYVVPLTDLADGEHTITAIAYDFKPNKVTAEIKVTVDKRCPADGTCWLGGGGAGASCSAGGDCTSGVCAKKDGKGVCAERCDAAGASCPDGTSCQTTATQDQLACVAAGGFSLDTSGTGGCAVGGRGGSDARGAADATLLVLALGALLALRRRRR